MASVKNILGKMLFRKDLYNKIDKVENQRFFATDSALQDEYNRLCDLCSIMSNNYYRMVSEKGEDDDYVIKYKKELDKKRLELDEFCKIWDVKF